MKPFFVGIVCLVFATCDSGPMISGRPASAWIEALDDLNPETCLKALMQLQMADDATLQKAKPKLEALARRHNSQLGPYDSENYLALSAARLLFKIDEVCPECAGIYADSNEVTSWGKLALKKLYKSHPRQVVDAIKRSSQLDNGKNAIFFNELLKSFE